jgi:hypothetical protein
MGGRRRMASHSGGAGDVSLGRARCFVSGGLGLRLGAKLGGKHTRRLRGSAVSLRLRNIRERGAHAGFAGAALDTGGFPVVARVAGVRAAECVWDGEGRGIPSRSRRNFHETAAAGSLWRARRGFPGAVGRVSCGRRRDQGEGEGPTVCFGSAMAAGGRRGAEGVKAPHLMQCFTFFTTVKQILTKFQCD